MALFTYANQIRDSNSTVYTEAKYTVYWSDHAEPLIWINRFDMCRIVKFSGNARRRRRSCAWWSQLILWPAGGSAKVASTLPKTREEEVRSAPTFHFTSLLHLWLSCRCAVCRFLDLRRVRQAVLWDQGPGCCINPNPPASLVKMSSPLPHSLVKFGYLFCLQLLIYYNQPFT